MSELAVIEKAEVVPSLDELAVTINNAIKRSRDALDAGVREAIEVGRQLTEARALVPRGEWMRWIRSQVIADYHAISTYMQLYSYREVIGSAPSVIVAQRMLARAPREEAIPDLDPDDVRRLASAGWAASNIAAHLGVSVQVVQNVLDPSRITRKLAKKRANEASKRSRIRHERAIKAERVGGGINASFKQIRSTQLVLNSLSETGATPEIRQAATLAYRAVCRAEDEIAKILSLA